MLKLIICFILLFSGVLQALPYKHFSLENSYRKYIEEANIAYENNEFEKTSALLEKSLKLKKSGENYNFYLKSLFKLKRYEKILQYIKIQSDYHLEEHPDLFYFFYNLSLIKLSQKTDPDFLNDKINQKIFKEIYENFLLYLIIQKDFANAVKFSRNNNPLSAIPYYELDNYDEAFEIISKNSTYKIPTYLHCIDFLNNKKYKFPFFQNYENCKLHVITDFFQRNKLKKIKTIIYSLKDQDLRNYLFSLYWNLQNKPRIALDFSNKISPDKFPENYLSYLNRAEIFYKTENFNTAVNLYKLLRRNYDKNTSYLNYAIGYSYKNIYKYNSTAYYWIKNLQINKSFYDSLSRHNLANLYTFTKHDQIAFDYYFSFLNKYQADNSFYSSYIRNLSKLNYWNYLEEFYNKFNQDLNQTNYLKLNKLLAINSFENKDYIKTKFYCDNFLAVKNDTEISLLYEKSRFELNEFGSKLNYLEYVLEKYPNHPQKEFLQKQLLNLYIQNKDSQKIIDFQNSYPDSTYWGKFYKAHALKLQGKRDSSAHLFVEIFKNSSDSLLWNKAYKQIFPILKKVKLDSAFSLLENQIETLNSDAKQKKYLQLNALLFENNNEYEQAIQVYKTISPFPDSTKISLKIAENYYEIKEYEKSLNFLEKITKTDSLLFTEKLYLKLLNARKLKNDKLYISTLLDFYNFDSTNSEITNLIINFYNKNNFKLFTYHFLLNHSEKSLKQIELQKHLKKHLGPRTQALKQIEDYNNILKFWVNFVKEK